MLTEVRVVVDHVVARLASLSFPSVSDEVGVETLLTLPTLLTLISLPVLSYNSSRLTSKPEKSLSEVDMFTQYCANNIERTWFVLVSFCRSFFCIPHCDWSEE